MTDLATLPPAHPLRNVPLKDIGAEIRNKQSKTWRCVKSWKIGKATYNEVEKAWSEFNEFRVNLPVVPLSQLTQENP